MAKAKKSNRGKRYSAAEKAKILATAKKEKLTGAQVRKRFGVSTLTFYRWRGPVNRRRGARMATTSSRNGRGVDGQMREDVRAEVRRVLPGVIRQEVAAYLDEILRPKK
jgi:transposase-like protein